MANPSQKKDDRPYSAGQFALELDQKDEVGLFRSIEGGGIKNDVMTYQHGVGYDRWRQLGKPKHEDIKLHVGMSMSRPFYDWMESFFQQQVVRKSGAIVAADFDFFERARRDFQGALIREIAFPKLGGNDTNAFYIGVTFAVEEIKPTTTANGKSRKLTPPVGFDNQKAWSPNNFRLRIDGISDALCRECTAIEPITIKQNILEYHGGGLRAPQKIPTVLEYPNITIHMPESSVDGFLAHFEKRGINGEVPGRLTGMIQTYDNDNKDLFTLSFQGADICSVQPAKSDATTEDVKLVKIELYTERITFKYHQ